MEEHKGKPSEEENVCLFPQLTQVGLPAPTSAATETVGLELGISRVMKERFSYDRLLELQVMLSTVWATVIHRFAEANPIFFAMVIDDGVSASTKSCRNLWKTLIDPTTSVGVLKDIKRWEICPLAEHHQGSFNTGLFILSKNLESSQVWKPKMPLSGPVRA